MKSTLFSCLLFTLLFCFAAGADTGTTLQQRSTGETITSSFFNDLTNALNGTLVPRHATTGAPTAGSDLGSSTYPWGASYVGSVTSTGTIQSTPGSAAAFKMVGGWLDAYNTAASGKYNWRQGPNLINNNRYEFAPSTAVDGTTFSTYALGVDRSFLLVQAPSGSNAGSIQLRQQASSGFYNFLVSGGYNANNRFEITPSTAADGATFSNAVFQAVANTGAVTLGNATLGGATTFPVTTEATSGTAAGVIMSGGLSVAKKVWAVGDLVTDASILAKTAGGYVVGTTVTPFTVKAIATNSEGFEFNLNTATDAVSLWNGYNAPLCFGVNDACQLTMAATSGAATFSGGTASSSTSTGQVIVQGGIGVSGQGYFGGAVNAVGVAATGASTFTTWLAEINSGSEQLWRVRNAGAGNAVFGIMSEEAVGGDPYLRFTINGQTSWSTGIDNSDSDAFVISHASTIGTSNLLRMGTGTAGTTDFGVSGNTTLFRFYGARVLFPDGLVGTPGWGFEADSNNGAYRVGTDDWALVSAGTERIRLDAGGNVAIGGTSTTASRVNSFMWVPSTAGTPTGVPDASYAGRFPLVFDSTNNKICVYDGAWLCSAALL